MQRPCKNCGYESPEADKFCRQCGHQLMAESEFSSAATLNQARAESNPSAPGVGTGRFAPSIGDITAGETERYYYPPQYAAPPPAVAQPPNFVQYAPAPVSTPAPAPFSLLRSLSGFFKGLILLLLFAGLLGATAAAVFFSQEARHERRQRYNAENEARKRVERDNANGRAQDAWEQMEEALRLTQEAAERAANAGAMLTGSGEKPIDLNKYAYPAAQVEAKIGSYGSGALSLLTRGDFNEVRAFYEQKFGRPVIQMAAGDRKRLLFQSSTSPPFLTRIEEMDEDRVKITILHSILRFPKDDDVQSQNRR